MGTRKELQRKVKNHLKDLEKRGINVNRVTQGKDVKALAWNKKTYQKFMERKQAVLQQERDVKKRTNSQGYVFSPRDYKEIKKLQDKFNRKKQSEFKKYLKMNTNLSDLEKDFLLGATVRHINSSENIELQVNFGKENLIDSINENINIKTFIEMTKERIEDFSMNDVIADKSEYFKKGFLNKWLKSGDLTPIQADEFMKLYKDMDIIEKSQLNKDMNRKLTNVDSAGTHAKSKTDVYHALKEMIFLEEKRIFVKS